ncbi:MAG: prepilin peptidase [Acidimicrobiales bacterium]
MPLGLVAGGFVTMLADRIPDATALSWRSRCPACSHRLALAETVPVVSWFRRGGRCGHCAQPITPAYPVVEAVTAVLWVVVAARFGWDWRLLPPLVMVTALMALSVIDFYVYRLPDRLVFPSLGISATTMVIAAIGIGHVEALGKAAVGMVMYFLIFFVLHLISPPGWASATSSSRCCSVCISGGPQGATGTGGVPSCPSC